MSKIKNYVSEDCIVFDFLMLLQGEKMGITSNFYAD